MKQYFYREQFVLFQLVTRAVILQRPVLRYYIHGRKIYNCKIKSSLLCQSIIIISNECQLPVNIYCFIQEMIFDLNQLNFLTIKKSVGVWRALLAAKCESGQRSWLSPLSSGCTFHCRVHGEISQRLHSYQALTFPGQSKILAITQGIKIHPCQ